MALEVTFHDEPPPKKPAKPSYQVKPGGKPKGGDEEEIPAWALEPFKEREEEVPAWAMEPFKEREPKGGKPSKEERAPGKAKPSEEEEPTYQFVDEGTEEFYMSPEQAKTFLEHIRDIPPQMVKEASKGLMLPFEFMRMLGEPEFWKKVAKPAAQMPLRVNVPGAQAAFQKEREVLEAGAESPTGKAFRETFQKHVAEPYKKFAEELPSAAKVEEALEPYVGEAKNPFSKAFGRMANLYTSGLYFPGGETLKPAITAGTLGQIGEEAGLGPEGQAILEGVGFVLGGLGGRPLPIRSTKSAKIDMRIDSLRRMGFNDQQITMIKNAMEPHGVTYSIAKPTKQSNLAFDLAMKEAEKTAVQAITGVLPGYDRGPDYVRAQAIKILNEIEDESRKFNLTNTKGAIKGLRDLQSDMSRVLALTPERKDLINYFEEMITGLQRRVSPWEFKVSDTKYPGVKVLEGYEKDTGRRAGYIEMLEQKPGHVVIEMFYANPDYQIISEPGSPVKIGKKASSGFQTALMKEFADLNKGKQGYVTEFTDAGKKYTESAIGRKIYNFDYRKYPDSGRYETLLRFKPEDIEHFNKRYDKIINKVKPINVPADYAVASYRDINAKGNWENPRMREYVFRKTKDIFRKLFEEQGPQGKKFLELFDRGNEAFQNAIYAEKIAEMFHNATEEIAGVNRVNFAKLSKDFHKPQNFTMLKEALGETRANNLRLIVKGGQSIQLLQKKIEGGPGKGVATAGKMISAGVAISTMSWGALGGIIGVNQASKIATRILTDPRMQNLDLKLIDALKTQKYNVARSIVMKMEKMVEDDPVPPFAMEESTEPTE